MRNFSIIRLTQANHKFTPMHLNFRVEGDTILQLLIQLRDNHQHSRQEAETPWTHALSVLCTLQKKKPVVIPFLTLPCVFGNDLPVLTVSTRAAGIRDTHEQARRRNNQDYDAGIHRNRHLATYRSSRWKIRGKWILFPTQPSLLILLVVSYS